MNHTFKQLVIALGMIGATGAASANSHYYGDLTDVMVYPDYTTEGFFNVPLDFSTRFNHLHFFSVGLPAAGSGTLSSSIIFNPSGSFRKAIAGLDAFLWSDVGLDVGVFDIDDIELFELGLGTSGNSNAQKTGTYITDGGQLTPGNYFIAISGFGVGTSGGTYSFTASAIPVPEPETWAMLLAGLGLVGLQLRRRNNSGKIAIN